MPKTTRLRWRGSWWCWCNDGEDAAAATDDKDHYDDQGNDNDDDDDDDVDDEKNWLVCLPAPTYCKFATAPV